MDTFSVIVGFVTVLLGLALPIITQITKDDRFTSDGILDLYEKNNSKKIFDFSLKISLGLIVIYLFKCEPLFDFENKSIIYLFENSALILLSISTFILVGSFLVLVRIIRIFQRNSSLMNYLIKKDKIELKNNNLRYFNALSDMLIWAIKNQNQNIALTISRHFYTDYRIVRDKNCKDENGVVYPTEFYNSVFRIVQAILIRDNNQLLFLEDRTVGGIYLLGEFVKNKISEKTYLALWGNLSLSLKHKRGDLVYKYWKTADTYFKFSLSPIKEDYEVGEYRIKNQQEIINREAERERFLEFLYALGGLVLYKEDLNLIKKFFNYTTSTPAQRPLLPMHMTEVFEAFFKFYDPYERNFPWISQKYSFPNLDSTSDLSSINNWICKYIGILYLRQFNITTNYTFQKPLEQPNMPSDIATKKMWLTNLNHFKIIIENLLLDSEMLETLDFSKNEPQNGLDYLSVITQFEVELQKNIEKNQIEIGVDKEKKNLFFNKSKSILTSTFNVFSEIFHHDSNIENLKTIDYSVKGLSTLSDKEIFYDSGIDHLNFDSFLAEQASINFRDNIMNIFVANVTNQYILNQEDIFKAVDILNIDNNYRIISFGLNLEYCINHLNISNLSTNSYKEIKINSFPYSPRITGNTLFIVKESDLPRLNFLDIDKKTIIQNEFDPIDNKFFLYGSVSDLNKNDSLRNELVKTENKSESELKKKVFQAIAFNGKLSWLENIKMVSIQIKYNWDTQKKVTDLDDIKPF